MTREKQDFFDRFQQKGIWWLPETPDKTVQGVLTHDEDETTLDLFGTLREVDITERGRVTVPAPTPIIYGQLESGQLCTLYKNRNLSENLNLFGGTATSSKWGSGVMFLGGHIPDPTKFDFADWTVAYTGLEEWMADHPFKPPDIKREGERVVEVGGCYVVPQKFEVTIPSLGAKLESDYVLSSGRKLFRSQTWEHSAYLILKPDTPKGFDWYMEALRDVQNFLLLCIGQPISPRSIVASEIQRAEEGEPKEQEIHVYYHYTNRRERDPRHPAEMMMPLFTIRHMLSEMVNAWFSKAEKLRDVYNLFFGTFYNESLYLESAFLSLIQALETYSRSVRKAQYVEESAYAKIAAALNAAIPADTPPDLKQSLKSRIKYGNEYSLRKRLKEILDSLEADTLKLVCDDPARFRNRIVDTRNYLTHYSEELKDDAIRGADLYYANLRMKLLLIILLCKEIGVNEDSIKKMLMQNPTWLQLIHLYLAKGS